MFVKAVQYMYSKALSCGSKYFLWYCKSLWCTTKIPFVFAGMHKKSVEAAATLETEEVMSGTEQKSDSIAALRARAKEHNAKLLTALCGEEGKNSDSEANNLTSSHEANSFNFKDL